MEPKIAAFVPMRHNSERVPGKNYRPFAGRPLYHYIIDSLLKCSCISEVVIDTDSDLIIKEAPTVFPSVRVLVRPEHLRDGHIPMNDVLLNSVKQVPADFYLQTHSTNPLLRPETITDAVEQFLGNQDKYDSLFSVTRLQTRLWWSDGSAVNHDPNVLLRTQDLPPVYEENSCLYIFNRETLERRGNRIGEHPLLYEIAREEAADIDVELDFAITEFLYKRGG